MRLPKQKGFTTKKLQTPLKSGAQEQNRTADTGIFSPLLYRLSYLGSKQSTYKFFLGPCQGFFVLRSPNRFWIRAQAVMEAVSALRILGPRE